jgi:hypothetical protein
MGELSMEHQDDTGRAEQPFKDCFARSCCHHANGQCKIYMATRPPTITVDGTCLGYGL